MDAPLNDILTPLAVVGIMMFVAALVLVGIYFAQEVLTIFRLFRAGHVKVRATWDSPLEPQLPQPAEIEDRPDEPDDTPRGWGFDR